jgi:hypothetical protein
VSELFFSKFPTQIVETIYILLHQTPLLINNDKYQIQNN